MSVILSLEDTFMSYCCYKQKGFLIILKRTFCLHYPEPGNLTPYSHQEKRISGNFIVVCKFLKKSIHNSPPPRPPSPLLSTQTFNWLLENYFVLLKEDRISRGNIGENIDFLLLLAFRSDRWEAVTLEG